MVRDRDGRGARRGTAVRAGVGRRCGPPPGRSTARRRDERHAAQRRGERRLADVRAQLLEQPLLAPEDDQHHERQESRPAGRLYARREHVGQLRNHADRGGRDHVHHVAATPNNIVRAFDLRTQKMLWHYEHKNGPVSTACCGPNNRGVAVSGGSVFLGTLDDYLVALDATTGKVKWEVKVGDGPEAGYTETMAPLV